MSDGRKQCGDGVGSNCFIAGTLVLTAEGYKKIEDIQVGDKVLAYDEDTGEQAYKEVVRLFRNVTTEWYHIHVNEEEMVCTAEHPFFVPSLKEFVTAKDLKVGTELLLSDGTSVTIDEIHVEKLSKAETTYNFEVEDYHTYYVTNSKVLVHNDCYKAYSPEQIAEKYDISVNDFHRKVKPEILKQAKPTYKVGRNPDIMLNKAGDIAYQGANGRGFQPTGLNINKIIIGLGLTGG